MAKSFNSKEINKRFFELFCSKSRSEMAALLGVSQGMLSAWSKGKKQVPWDKLAYAKELSGKSWDWLLNGEEDEEAKEPGEVPGMDEKVALCLENATFIHQHLGEAQRYLLRGELSADAFLRLANSLLLEIGAAIDARRKRRQSSDTEDHDVGA